MLYVTSIERMGIEKGIQQGIQEGDIQRGQTDILEVLEGRFGAVPDAIAQQIRAIQDTDQLRTLHRRAIIIESLDAFQQTIDPVK